MTGTWICKTGSSDPHLCMAVGRNVEPSNTNKFWTMDQATHKALGLSCAPKKETFLLLPVAKSKTQNLPQTSRNWNTYFGWICSSTKDNKRPPGESNYKMTGRRQGLLTYILALDRNKRSCLMLKSHGRCDKGTSGLNLLFELTRLVFSDTIVVTKVFTSDKEVEDIRDGSGILVRGRGLVEFWPGGAWAQNLLKNSFLPKNCLKTAWFWKNLGGKLARWCMKYGNRK